MFTGSIVALVTPFDERGEIDFTAFDALIEWQIAEGSSAILIAGATGEGATLTNEEKISLFRRAVQVTDGRVPIIATTGNNSTRASIALTQAAKAVGVAGALVVFPYYNKPNFKGCKAHVEAVAAVGLPLILYHHPGRTGIKLTAEQLAELGTIKGVVGLKDSSGDIGLIAELLVLSGLTVLCGDDVLALPLLSLGAKGNIGIAANIVPRQAADLISAGRNGDFECAREIHMRLVPLFKALNREINPQGIKYAMGVSGRCGSTLRLPLVQVEKTTAQELERALESANSVTVR